MTQVKGLKNLCRDCYSVQAQDVLLTMEPELSDEGAPGSGAQLWTWYIRTPSSASKNVYCPFPSLLQRGTKT